MMNSQSKESAAYGSRAQQSLVGGVSSSFRINPFTGWPMYLSRADGPYIYGLDGREYVDFFMGHGACTLGHNRPELKAALQRVLDEIGFNAEYDHPLTAELAEKIVKHIPCAERVRYVNSGSEATLLAMRLARGYTGRDKVVRIDGHFHGGHDYVLPNNLVGKIDRDNPGNRLSNFGPMPTGTPAAVRETIYLAPWNHAEVIEKLAQEKGDEIAAVMLNPIDFNNGCIGTTTEYLQELRRICDAYDMLLIFDEILAGFRTGISCAQGYYGVTPDVCLLGKALTNGVPLGAIAGKEKVMMKIMDPENPVVAGGTYSGNLLGCAAGVAAMSIMEEPGFFPAWIRRVEQFLGEVQTALDEEGLPARVQNMGVSFYIYIGTRDPIRGYADFSKLKPELAKKFFTKCIEKGLYFHTDFTVSARHDEALLERAVETLRMAARETVAEGV
jgi:glutamate-1-semialdehyde 2,1-aminomutase